MSYYIYKLIITETPFYYIGKTNMSNRLVHHRSDCYNSCRKYKIKLYLKIRDELKISIEDFYNRVKELIIVKNLTDEEANIYEGKAINLDNEYCLNSRRENINRRLNDKEYTKQWRIKNKDKIKKDQREIYLKKRDERLEKQKKYRETNKDKINKKEKCNKCGKVILKRGMKRHQEGKGCLNN